MGEFIIRENPWTLSIKTHKKQADFNASGVLMFWLVIQQKIDAFITSLETRMSMTCQKTGPALNPSSLNVT